MQPTDDPMVPPELLMQKRILLGVTGGIAAYKAPDLASYLVQQGVLLRVVMTDAATRFVGPMTFEAITRNPVRIDVFDGWQGDEAGHVTLASDADAIVVAPATANSIANIAHGFAADMLSTVLLSTIAPIVVAPAMEHHMWHHPATQRNVDLLKDRGVVIVTPEKGHLASGANGDGRLASRDRILATLRKALANDGPLQNTKVVVTAGGTHERIDPVRFIGNRSSGRMGVAIAEAAFDAGADVTTVIGPSVLVAPTVGDVLHVESAEEMASTVDLACEDADVLVMAAAVADFRPQQPTDRKIKKTEGDGNTAIALTTNRDILASIQREGLLKIGFAAETDDLVASASAKLRSKGLGMIVANDAVSTIGAKDSEAILLFPDGMREELPAMSKNALARVIVDRIGRILGYA